MVMLAVISHFSSPKLDQKIAISKGSPGHHLLIPSRNWEHQKRQRRERRRQKFAAKPPPPAETAAAAAPAKAAAETAVVRKAQRWDGETVGAGVVVGRGSVDAVYWVIFFFEESEVRLHT